MIKKLIQWFKPRVEKQVPIEAYGKILSTSWEKNEDIPEINYRQFLDMSREEGMPESEIKQKRRFTVKEAAVYLNISYQYFCKCMRNGKFPRPDLRKGKKNIYNLGTLRLIKNKRRRAK